MADDAPPLEIARVGGLFSERQIVLPLTVATLITLAVALTVAHFQALAVMPEGLHRYLGNGYCQVMIGLFFAITLYAALHYLGLHVERRHLQQRCGPVADSRASRWLDWLGYLSGRRADGDEDFPGVLRRWYGNARSREDFAHLSDYFLLLRGQQHQHNFAPIGFAIWVLPLLGFIGTVVGITQAIGGLEQAVAPAEAGGSLGTVLGGLKFAFDTTFVGLVLVIPIMLYLLALRARAQKLDMVYYQILLDRRFHAAPA